MSSSDPLFLDLDLVDLLHQDSLAKFGGSSGVRDQAGLESAIVAPQNIFLNEYGDLFEIAAGHAFQIAEAQAYLDGYKRTAMGAALLFPRENSIPVLVENPMVFYEAMIEIANGTMNRPALANLFRKTLG